MARPSKYDTGPVITVKDADGNVASFCDGAFTPAGSPMVKNAIEAAERGQEYRLMGAWVKCDLSTPLGVIAALCNLNPGRSWPVDPPDDVRGVLDFHESGLSLEHPEGTNV